jgi:hypothetical protein
MHNRPAHLPDQVPSRRSSCPQPQGHLALLPQVSVLSLPQQDVSRACHKSPRSLSHNRTSRAPATSLRTLSTTTERLACLHQCSALSLSTTTGRLARLPQVSALSLRQQDVSRACHKCPHTLFHNRTSRAPASSSAFSLLPQQDVSRACLKPPALFLPSTLRIGLRATIILDLFAINLKPAYNLSFGSLTPYDRRLQY